MKWRFDHRSYDRNLSNCKFKPEKNFRASTGYEPMASALALQCSTNWALETLISGAGQRTTTTAKNYYCKELTTQVKQNKLAQLARAAIDIPQI